MTPEERARAVVGAHCFGPGWTAGPSLIEAIEPAIAATIRAAVVEEREACARLAGSNCSAWDDEADGESVIRSQALYGMADAGREIAAAIRARGAT